MVLYPFGMLGIFMLERRFPAIPSQRTLSTGLVHDALWVVIEAAVWLVIAMWYGAMLYNFYSRHLAFLTLRTAHSLPVALRLVIGAVAMDFARWLQHWFHHRLSFLWPFHAVHHAQRELNQFSSYRNHIVEQFLRYTVLVLPMLMLNLQEPAVIWWILILTWHNRLCHANIRSNFGPLCYFVVTPQSHRIHHSLHPEHFDQNYGAILTVWDCLFGTQCREYDVYPATGIDDETFPAESAHSVRGVLATNLRQWIYPFRQLWIGRNRASIASSAAADTPARKNSNRAAGRWE